MTRVNSAIPVRCLTDEHLLAEHREIKRLPYNLEQARKSGSINAIPEEFTLNKGHVLFFLDKLSFVVNRLNELHEECLRRGFQVVRYSDNFANIEQRFFNDYTPTAKEREILIEQISKRITESPRIWHYCGKKLTKQEALQLLFQCVDKVDLK